MISSEHAPLGLRIGKLVYATRRHLGLSQADIGPQIGLNQSALSRVENGQQMLTATQWFVFCSATGISPDSFASGLIDLDLQENAIHLPRRYTSHAHTSVRWLRPMIEHAEALLGADGFERFLQERKLAPEYFLNLGARVSYAFKVDLAELLASQSARLPGQELAFTVSADKGRTHGKLQGLYDLLWGGQLQLIEAFVNYRPLYHQDFEYEVIEKTDRSLDLAISPCAHIQSFDFARRKVDADFLGQLENAYLENLSGYGGQKPLQVTLLDGNCSVTARYLLRISRPESES